MSEDGPRSAHIRWASTGEGRSGRSMDVPRGPLSDDDGEKRLVIAEVSLPWIGDDKTLTSPYSVWKQSK
jgi:hypothetical protein